MERCFTAGAHSSATEQSPGTRDSKLALFPGTVDQPNHRAPSIETSPHRVKLGWWRFSLWAGFWFLNMARPGRARRVAISRQGPAASAFPGIVRIDLPCLRKPSAEGGHVKTLSRKEARKGQREAERSRTGRDACVTLGEEILGGWHRPVLPLPPPLLCPLLSVSAPLRDQETFWEAREKARKLGEISRKAEAERQASVSQISSGIRVLDPLWSEAWSLMPVQLSVVSCQSRGCHIILTPESLKPLPAPSVIFLIPDS